MNLFQQGKIISQATRQIGIVDQTYYKWRREYGGMRVDQVNRLRHLEKQNLQLKKLFSAQEILNLSIIQILLLKLFRL